MFKFLFFILVLISILSCKTTTQSETFNLSKRAEYTFNLPYYIDINNIRSTLSIQTIANDTVINFIDRTNQFFYSYSIKSKVLAEMRYEVEGPARLKSEPYYFQSNRTGQMIIFCQKHIVFSKFDNELEIVDEVDLLNEKSQLMPGQSFLYRKFVDSNIAYFLEYSFDKNGYNNKIVGFNLDSKEYVKIKIPDYFVETMNKGENDEISTSLLLPTFIPNGGSIIFSSWFSNKVFVDGNQIIFDGLFNYYEDLMNENSLDKIFDLFLNESRNSTLIFDSKLNSFIVIKKNKNKETGFSKDEICFWDTTGRLINCTNFKGILKYHTAKHLFFLNILELEDKASISIYEIDF